MDPKSAKNHNALLRQWRALPLRKQIIAGLWICMLPTTMIGSIVVGKAIFERGKNNLERKMIFGAATVSQIINEWVDDHHDLLVMLSNDPDINKLDPAKAHETLKRLKKAMPEIATTVYKLDGEAIASNTGLELDNTKSRKNERIAAEWFKNAKEGTHGLDLWQTTDGSSCLTHSRGLYNQDQVIGIVRNCEAPGDIGENSGVEQIVKLQMDHSNTPTYLNFDKDINKGIGLALISRQTKQLVLLHLEGKAATNNGQLIHPVEVQKSRWFPFAETVSQTGPEEKVTVQSIDHYLVASIPIRDDFVLAFILNTAPFIETFLLAGIGAGAVNLTALIVSSIALMKLCKTILKPIDITGESLRQMSTGNFKVTLPKSTCRDAAKLYGYVEASSYQLRKYFQEVTHNAATNAQLEQAKKLQLGFLVDKLPTNQWYAVDAICKPAYEIGADWYDAFTPETEGDESVFIVVADVCDKGIGSALYMSVFRSLLRLSLLKEWESRKSCGSSIQAALEDVNDYMASNHGHDAMFATAFVAAYTPCTQVMEYVVAGHEPPLVYSKNEITQLKPSGPAIGIFPNASYQTHHLTLEQDSIVLAYSDGLIDTRDINGKSLGIRRVKEAIKDKGSQSWEAADLINKLNQLATTYRGEAEQFDDLTMLALKIMAVNRVGT